MFQVARRRRPSVYRGATDSFVWQRARPPIRDIYGRVSSQYGSVPCRLRNGMDEWYDFTVTILERGHIEVLAEVKRALGPHIVG